MRPSGVVGVGLDAVELARMRVVLDRTPRFADRAFTDDERAYCDAKRDPTERYAARFAAKEAVLKVLGEGILSVPLRAIEVVRLPTGKPTVRLHGTAAERADALGITTWRLSLTHTDTTASAVAIGLHDETDTAVAAAPADAFYSSLDRKRNGSGALIFDEAGDLLVVEPTYKPGWTVPGGAVDAGESPRQACEREILEEIGLRRRVGRLLAVEWRRWNDVMGESMLYLFDGGTLSPGEAAAIVLPPDELSAHAFVPADEAVGMITSAATSRRVRVALAALAAGSVAWLDDGEVVAGGPAPG